MKYRIVQSIEGRFVRDETDDIFAWAEVRGFEIVKLNSNPRHRAELQGQPVLARFCGPMWDGDAIRYEDRATNDAMSQ